MSYLLQHPGIRTGNSCEAERRDTDTRYQNIQIMDGNGDFAKLTSFVAGYKKYVKAFTQMPFPGKRIFFV
jgi:hypothetical protein